MFQNNFEFEFFKKKMDFTGNSKNETLPVEILEKVIRLHRHFYNFLEISMPMARATGMIYFNKFFTTRKIRGEPKYALYAVACLHLATKMCECPRSLNKFVEIIYEAWDNPDYVRLFEGLDGISKPESDQSYVKDLIRQLISAEMDVIQHFNFVFEVKLPYEYCDIYISEILKWHMPMDYEYFEPLKQELQKLSWAFLNDLLFTPLFYTHKPELVALVCIKLSFERIGIPLISPRNQQWFNILCPLVDCNKFDNLYFDAQEFFIQTFATQKISITQQRETPVPNEVMTNWHNYPFQMRLSIPQCPPPPFEMLQETAGTSKAFTRMDADHVPFFPPPQSLTDTNPELLQLTDEMKQLQQILDNKAQNKKQKNKNKEKKNKKDFKNDKNKPRKIDSRNEFLKKDDRDFYRERGRDFIERRDDRPFLPPRREDRFAESFIPDRMMHPTRELWDDDYPPLSRSSQRQPLSQPRPRFDDRNLIDWPQDYRDDPRRDSRRDLIDDFPRRDERNTRRDYDRERNINYDMNRNEDYNRDRKTGFNRERNRDFERERSRDFDKERGRDFIRERDIDYNRDRDRDRPIPKNRNYGRDRGRDSQYDRDFDRNRNRDNDRPPQKNRNPNQKRDDNNKK